ncbi:MAG TPA: PIG-L family deacetylase, partial [Flavisolibacter sp.]
MKNYFLTALACFSLILSKAQTPAFPTSGDIYLGLKKLNVLGSVLYVAAHPDDENTRLLTYFSKDKLYRTGYLSLTRGDGGQNLIGEEQGIELGLIRTQELLAARRIDGAEQFFTRAYDFGFSKSPQETFTKWDKEKILSDVVWVIRKFQPDVIVTRFPTTGEGGHGQHTASAILAVEAFTAAADAGRFPEQLKYVKPWQAKRILWNTFNFGANNTTGSDQFKIDVGGFNPVLGKGYGEIAAESRSQHKSQGFGSARARGEAIEYFRTLQGDAPVNDLLDGVSSSWTKVNGGEAVEREINSAIAAFDFMQPQKSLGNFLRIQGAISNLPDSYWRTQKIQEISKLIEQASGMWVEAFTTEAYVTQGDSMKVNIAINDRLGVGSKLLSVQVESFDSTFNAALQANKNFTFNKTIKVYDGTPPTHPYWLQKPMQPGYFEIPTQAQVGEPDVEPAFTVTFRFDLLGRIIYFYRRLNYKSVNQVKGEQYQPVTILPPVSVNTNPGLLLLNLDRPAKQNAEVQVVANRNIVFKTASIGLSMGKQKLAVKEQSGTFSKNAAKRYNFEILPGNLPASTIDAIPTVRFDSAAQHYLALANIRHDHIPNINYFYTDWLRLVPLHLAITKSKIGYIVGAGDKVPAALEQMGYDVTLLTDKELERNNLQQFDAIISGV